MTGERVISLEGVWNVRDLGGYATVDGRTVRRGVVFRSGGLHRLSAGDLATLEQLGLRVVYDLRLDQERELAPSRLSGRIRHELVPIGGAAARTEELNNLVRENRLAEVPDDFLVRVYDAMAEVAAPAFGVLLTRLAEPDGLPALFHCTAGKDRTGVAAALLLSVLGVHEESILDDYELSAIHYTKRKLATFERTLAGSGIDVERYRAVFGAPRNAMSTLLSTLRDRCGSVETYLTTEAGVSAEVLVQLRTRLLEPEPDHRT